MQQQNRKFRRSVYAAGLVACTFLLIAFGWLAWLEARAAAQQSDTALDSTIRTVEDMTVAARSEAFERLAIAGRQVSAGLHDAGDHVALDSAVAQNRLDTATYIVGVGATLMQLQSGRFVALASSPRRGDSGRERSLEAAPDASIAADLRRGRGWSGILQRNGEWLAVSYRPMDPPFGDQILRLETPLPLREVERYLEGWTAPDAFIVLHDAGGLVRLRTRGAPDAVSIDQIEPLLHAQGWVRHERRLADTELSVLAAYRPFAAVRRPLVLCAAGLACALLSGLLLLRHMWRRGGVEAIALLRDIGQLAADLQHGRNAYALTQCGRSDEIGALAGALVRHAHERPASSHARTPPALGADA